MILVVGDGDALVRRQPVDAWARRLMGFTAVFAAGGDGDGYTIEQEFKDVAVVVDGSRPGATPQWPECLRGARTVLRAARAEHVWVYQPGGLDLGAPTLVPVGTETSPTLMRSTPMSPVRRL